MGKSDKTGGWQIITASMLLVFALTTIPDDHAVPPGQWRETPIVSGKNGEDTVIHERSSRISDAAITDESENNPPARPPDARLPRAEIMKLRKEYGNNDIIGYLRVEGTAIAFPVVQAEDNEYYLTRDINRKWSKSGWAFLDFENNVYFHEPNTIIYGHNSKSGEVFNDLDKYRDAAFFEKHRFIEFDTLYDRQRWEVFSFFRTDTGFDYIRISFPTKSDYASLLDGIKKRSIHESGVSVSPNDRILSLSTCTNEGLNLRYVLSAKLV